MNQTDYYLRKFKQSVSHNIRTRPFDFLAYAGACIEERPFPWLNTLFLDDFATRHFLHCEEHKAFLADLSNQFYLICLTELQDFLNYKSHQGLSTQEKSLLEIVSCMTNYQQLRKDMVDNGNTIKNLGWSLQEAQTSLASLEEKRKTLQTEMNQYERFIRSDYYQFLQRSLQQAKAIKHHLPVINIAVLMSAIFSPYFLLVSLLFYRAEWFQTVSYLFKHNPLLLTIGFFFPLPIVLSCHFILKQKIKVLEEAQQTLKDHPNHLSDLKYISGVLLPECSETIQQTSYKLSSLEQKQNNYQLLAETALQTAMEQRQELKQNGCQESTFLRNQNSFFNFRLLHPSNSNVGHITSMSDILNHLPKT